MAEGAFRVHVDYDPASMRWLVYVFERTQEPHIVRQHSIGEHGDWAWAVREIEVGSTVTDVEPSLVLPREIGEALAEALARAALPLSAREDSALFKATKEHLADMRKVVDALLRGAG